MDIRIRSSTFIGALIWLGLLAFPLETGLLNTIARILLLGMLILLPLGISLAKASAFEKIPPQPDNIALFLQPFAAVIAGAAFFLPKGPLSGMLAIVWLPLTGFVAWYGLLRLQKRGLRRTAYQIEEAFIDAGLVYLPIGAVWFLGSRMGDQMLGFGEPIILLTAVHFHYAGFAAPILAGLVGRGLRIAQPQKYPGGVRNPGKIVVFELEASLPASDYQVPIPIHKQRFWIWRSYRLVAIVVILGPAIVALGITFSSIIEVISATLLAFAYLGLAFITLWIIIPQIKKMRVRLLLGVSSISAIVTMLASVVYAFGRWSSAFSISIPQMVIVHGWVNALGFVTCGLLGWSILKYQKGKTTAHS
jgi:hypothetical protein